MQKAQQSLYESLIREARAARVARRVGYRDQVFNLLKQARSLDVPNKDLSDLRREALACLGDFVPHAHNVSGFSYKYDDPGGHDSCRAANLQYRAASVSGVQPHDLTELGPNLAPPLQAHSAAPAKEFRGRHRVKTLLGGFLALLNFHNAFAVSTQYIRGMNSRALHESHSNLNARFTEVNGEEAVKDYGDVLAEYSALREKTGVLDLSFRGRLCLLGADRQRFLNGQVTNDVNALQPGQGCYAALINAKGKMISDLNMYVLDNEIVLDFEPGFSASVAQRLEKYVIADDVQVVNVASEYGLLSVQGPGSAGLISQLDIGIELPFRLMNFAQWSDPSLGEIYIMNLARTGTSGFDLFVPTASLGAIWNKLVTVAQASAGRACGWEALEMTRIEAGIPRFGADIDETNLPPEAGLEKRAISYTKGCYIGQEVIARIRTYGQVAKALRGLRLPDQLKALPKKGDKLFKGQKEIGYLTSVLASPALRANVALGYVRREANQVGAEVTLRTSEGESVARIVEVPFR